MNNYAEHDIEQLNEIENARNTTDLFLVFLVLLTYERGIWWLVKINSFLQIFTVDFFLFFAGNFAFHGMTTTLVQIDANYLPDALMNTVCLVPAFFLNVIIVIAAVSIRERYKHTIVCHCILSIWSTFCNVSMYIIYMIAVRQNFVVTIEACTIFRNCLWVAPKGQLFLLALDRYFTVCRQKPLHLKTLWFLYTLIPVFVYSEKTINYVFGEPFRDEMCTMVYRMSKSLQTGALVLWGSMLFGCLVNLRVLIFIKFKQRQLKDHKCVKKSKKSVLMERRLTIVYLLLTIVPIIQLIPAVVVSVIREVTGFNSKALWVSAYMLLNLTPLIQAILIIVSIRSIKRRVWSMFRYRNMPAPTPSNTQLFSTTRQSDFPSRPTREFVTLLNKELMKLQSTPGVGLFEQPDSGSSRNQSL